MSDMMQAALSNLSESLRLAPDELRPLYLSHLLSKQLPSIAPDIAAAAARYETAKRDLSAAQLRAQLAAFDARQALCLLWYAQCQKQVDILPPEDFLRHLAELGLERFRIEFASDGSITFGGRAKDDLDVPHVTFHPQTRTGEFHSGGPTFRQNEWYRDGKVSTQVFSPWHDGDDVETAMEWTDWIQQSINSVLMGEQPR
jgi:hypothetical protein